jgi:RNA polymerase sigma-70 factor (ECF subfamily)
MDVLGYSLEEISGITATSIAAIKASLHRGRARLRELALQPDDAPLPDLAEPERSRLRRYVERFNARDFDAVRDMLADEVRLELVNRRRLTGRRDVVPYFENYARIHNWQFAVGVVDGRPAVVVRDPTQAESPATYFILLDWQDGRLVAIRDFHFARYAMEGAELVILE